LVAAGAVWGAWVAADRQAELSERLLTIEQERDHARLQVIANLYRQQGKRGTAFGVPVLVTVVNIGSALGGPVSVSIANDAGKDLSHMSADPVFIEPGKRVTFVVYFGGPQTDVDAAFPFDLSRRALSDFPTGRWAGEEGWIPVGPADGYFIRAWDPTTERNWWYPERPEQEPRTPPIIS
jgi:hypothetical protein